MTNVVINAQALERDAGRRTASDDVFAYLREEITSLRLKPGTKLSEGEVARQLDVSRQPVREAFIRLANLQLLLIRPQKATVVRRISEREILNGRFIRTAVELEVARTACGLGSDRYFADIERNLRMQQKAVERADVLAFHNLDYEFHLLFCRAAECEFAYRTIALSKAHADRLCILSLSNTAGLQDVYNDHQQIYALLAGRDLDGLTRVVRHHLSRLDGVIGLIRKQNAEFFEDD